MCVSNVQPHCCVKKTRRKLRWTEKLDNRDTCSTTLCRCETCVYAHARTHTHTRAHTRTHTQGRARAHVMHKPMQHAYAVTFSIPLFIRVRRLRDPLSVPGNKRHKRTPPVHPHTESPRWGIALPPSVDVCYAPARARHTRRNLRDACGRSVLPMSPMSSLLASLACSFIFTSKLRVISI